jgi:hypothetical protein
MAARPLRIFQNNEPTPVSPPVTNRMTLRELLPLIAVAQRMNLMWLNDFLDDEVVVTADLYDVLKAFQGCRPSA